MSTHSFSWAVVRAVSIGAATAALGGCVGGVSGSAGGPAGAGASQEGRIVGEQTTVYRAVPIERDGYVVTLESLSAEMRRNFTGTPGSQAYNPGWWVQLHLTIRDTRDERSSRVAGPLAVRSLVDEAGRELASKIDSAREYAWPQRQFTYAGKRQGSSSAQRIEATVRPGELPREFAVLAGDIVMEEITEAKTVSVPLAEPTDLELASGLRAVVREYGESRPSDKYRQMQMTLEAKSAEVPLIRSVGFLGPDGRMRDVNGNGWERDPDGARRSTYTFSVERDRKEAVAAKVDVVLAVREFRVPFEFRGIPVGRTR